MSAVKYAGTAGRMDQFGLLRASDGKLLRDDYRHDTSGIAGRTINLTANVRELLFGAYSAISQNEDVLASINKRGRRTDPEAQAQALARCLMGRGGDPQLEKAIDNALLAYATSTNVRGYSPAVLASLLKSGLKELLNSNKLPLLSTESSEKTLNKHYFFVSAGGKYTFAPPSNCEQRFVELFNALRKEGHSTYLLSGMRDRFGQKYREISQSNQIDEFNGLVTKISERLDRADDKLETAKLIVAELKTGQFPETCATSQKAVSDILKSNTKECELKTLAKLLELQRLTSEQARDGGTIVIGDWSRKGIQTAGLCRRFSKLTAEEKNALASDPLFCTRAIEKIGGVGTNPVSASELCKQISNGFKHHKAGKILAYLLRSSRFTDEAPDKSLAKLHCLKDLLEAFVKQADTDSKKLDAPSNVAGALFTNRQEMLAREKLVGRLLEPLMGRRSVQRIYREWEDNSNQAWKAGQFNATVQQHAQAQINALKAIQNELKSAADHESRAAIQDLILIFDAQRNTHEINTFLESCESSNVTKAVSAADAAVGASATAKASNQIGAGVGFGPGFYARQNPSEVTPTNQHEALGVLTPRVTANLSVGYQSVLSVTRSPEGGAKLSDNTGVTGGFSAKVSVGIGFSVPNLAQRGGTIGLKGEGEFKLNGGMSAGDTALVTKNPLGILALMPFYKGGSVDRGIQHSVFSGASYGRAETRLKPPSVDFNIAKQETAAVVSRDFKQNNKGIYDGFTKEIEESDIAAALQIHRVPALPASDIVWSGYEGSSTYTTALGGYGELGLVAAGGAVAKESSSTETTRQRQVYTGKNVFSVPVCGTATEAVRRTKEFFNVNDRHDIEAYAKPVLALLFPEEGVQLRDLAGGKTPTTISGETCEKVCNLYKQTHDHLNVLHEYFLIRENSTEVASRLQNKAMESARALDDTYGTHFSECFIPNASAPSESAKKAYGVKTDRLLQGNADVHLSKSYMDFLSVASSIDQTWQALGAYAENLSTWTSSVTTDVAKSGTLLAKKINETDEATPFKAPILLIADVRPFGSGFVTFGEANGQMNWTSKERAESTTRYRGAVIPPLVRAAHDPFSYVSLPNKVSPFNTTLQGTTTNVTGQKVVPPLENRIFPGQITTTNTASIYNGPNATNYALNSGDTGSSVENIKYFDTSADSPLDGLFFILGIQSAAVDVRKTSGIRLVKHNNESALLHSEIAYSIEGSEKRTSPIRLAPNFGMVSASFTAGPSTDHSATQQSLVLLGDDPASIASAYKNFIKDLWKQFKAQGSEQDALGALNEYFAQKPHAISMLVGYPDVDHITSMLRCHITSQSVINNGNPKDGDIAQAGFIGKLAATSKDTGPESVYSRAYQHFQHNQSDVAALIKDDQTVTNLLNKHISEVQFLPTCHNDEREILERFIKKNPGKTIEQALSAAAPEVRKIFYTKTQEGNDLFKNYLGVAAWFEHANRLATAALSWQTGWIGSRQSNDNPFAPTNVSRSASAIPLQ